MFVVTVQFEVRPEHRQSFRDAVLRQARSSLDVEAGCHVFDVCVDPDNDAAFYLYERYENSEAFEVHLDSKHYKRFDVQVAPWIAGKTVHVWTSLEAPR